MTTPDVDLAEPRSETAASRVFRWVILGGLFLMLGANLPGHLSYDSVVQLYEGRFEVRATWAPAILAWLLGRFDDLSPGTGLYVTAVGLVLFLSLLSLKSLRPRLSWAAPIVGLVLVLTPTLLIYPAIVWKDVLFAVLNVAGFICLAHAARGWDRPSARLAPLAGALVCLSLAVLVRQNGLVVVLVAAIALAWTARGGGWRSSAAWGVGGLVTALLLTQAMGVVAQPKGSTMTGDTDKGVRVLLHYDIVGAVAHDPRVGLEIVGRADPGAPAQIIKDGVRVYSPERVETFAEAPVFLRTLWRLPGGAVTAQWREIVLHHTGAYLEQRLDVFRWVFLTPTLDRCLPIWVGIAGPPDKLQALGLTAAVRPQDQALADYARGFFRTPAFSHLSYAVIALVTAGLLLLRRDPADVVIAALMFGALAFSASFFFITLACDYRYLYPLDLAAAAGLIYLALEPPLPARWRRTRTSAAGPGGPTLH